MSKKIYILIKKYFIAKKCSLSFDNAGLPQIFNL